MTLSGLRIFSQECRAYPGKNKKEAPRYGFSHFHQAEPSISCENTRYVRL